MSSILSFFFLIKYASHLVLLMLKQCPLKNVWLNAGQAMVAEGHSQNNSENPPHFILPGLGLSSSLD